MEQPKFILLLALAAFMASTSVIAINLVETDPLFLAAARLLIASVVLLPVYLGARKRVNLAVELQCLKRCIIPGVILAIHFATWNFGARMTYPANASLIVNLVPLAMPFTLFFLAREALNTREWLGTATVMAGLLFLGVADFNTSVEHLWGDLVCFTSMVAYAGYLTYGRRNRDFPSIWLYIVPVYAVAGLVSLSASFFTTQPLRTYAQEEWVAFLYLALGPTVAGHSLFNYCLKHVRGQVVALMNQTQAFWAVLTSMLFLNSFPKWTFLPAAALVVGGIVIVITARSMPSPPQAKN